MFNRTYKKLQAKKIAWFGLMLATSIFTFTQIPMMPVYTTGILLGIGLYHIRSFLPPAPRALLSILTFIFVYVSSLAIPFSVAYFGLYFHSRISNRKIAEALRNTHEMNSTEQADIDVINKLENKTSIRLTEKIVCDVDETKFSPNAAATRTPIANLLFVYSNLLKSPFTKKEKKAVFAHELGHINEMDSYVKQIASFLYWSTCTLAFMSLSFPAAAFILVLNQYAYYSIAQSMELLADQFAARHANPQALSQGLRKAKDKAKQIKAAQPDGIKKHAEKMLHYFWHKTGMTSHPSLRVRNTYLQEYAAEKTAARTAARSVNVSP